MVSTRQKLLDYLNTYQPASIREIGKGLGLTGPDILYHIQFLLENGEIELVQRDAGEGKSPARRGRPVKRYRLKNRLQPENYAFLAQTFFTELLSHYPIEADREQGLKDLAVRLLPLEAVEKPASVRISRLVQRLSENQYAARWEAHALGPRIIFANCPYLKVASACPDLCKLDRYLLEAHLGSPVVMLQNVFSESPGPRLCRFSVE